MYRAWTRGASSSSYESVTMLLRVQIRSRHRKRWVTRLVVGCSWGIVAHSDDDPVEVRERPRFVQPDVDPLHQFRQALEKRHGWCQWSRCGGGVGLAGRRLRALVAPARSPTQPAAAGPPPTGSDSGRHARDGASRTPPGRSSRGAATGPGASLPAPKAAARRVVDSRTRTAADVTESRAGTTATVTVTLVIAVVAATVASGATIGGALDHERAISGGSAISSMVWFIVGWTLMMLAMMLPTAATLVAAVGRLAESPSARVRLQVATSVGYLAIWAAIGYLFRAGDVFIHTLVDQVGWVLERPNVVDAAVLLIAGAFQFSSLKHRCLTACRAPTSFVYRYWRGGNALGSAARVGAAYGFSCVGVLLGVDVGDVRLRRDEPALDAAVRIRDGDREEHPVRLPRLHPARRRSARCQADRRLPCMTAVSIGLRL